MGKQSLTPTDVTRSEDCHKLAKKVKEKYGRIDGLINSAYQHGDWATTDIADADNWADTYNVNCIGALRMAQAVLPYMKSNSGGAIVNVSTMTTVNPFPGEASYAASKGGLNALTRHMAKDFGRFGIRVNYMQDGLDRGCPSLWIYRCPSK